MNLPFVAAPLWSLAGPLADLSSRTAMPPGDAEPSLFSSYGTEYKIAVAMRDATVCGYTDGPLYMAEALANVSCCGAVLRQRARLHRIARIELGGS